MIRVTVSDIARHKKVTPLVVISAYTAPMACLIDPHVDVLLVGDSLGMVLYGMENTRGVTLDMMIAHGRAVVNASSHALVVVDMPYGSYHQSKEQALKNCQRVIVETGAQAVKLEGGVEMAATIAHLVQYGIAVMGHVGLQPQRVTSADGYKFQGRTDAEAKAIEEDALAIEKAGVFSMVIEATSEPIARAVTAQLKVPTIGIGASAACDGQVLVIDDLLGITPRVPRFVKRYADLPAVISEAVASYAADVRARVFPAPEHVFTPKKE